MDEFKTVVDLLGTRFDRMDDKLDAFLKRQEELSQRVVRIEERQQTLSSQFKTTLGAIGAAVLACVGIVAKWVTQ